VKPYLTDHRTYNPLGGSEEAIRGTSGKVEPFELEIFKIGNSQLRNVLERHAQVLPVKKKSQVRKGETGGESACEHKVAKRDRLSITHRTSCPGGALCS